MALIVTLIIKMTHSVQTSLNWSKSETSHQSRQNWTLCPCGWSLRVWLLWPWHRKAQWLSQPKRATGLTCPLLLAQFLSTLMQAKEDHSHLCATSLKSTSPLLLPPKLAPGQPCVKLLFHPLHSDRFHRRVISRVFGLQFSSPFVSTLVFIILLQRATDLPKSCLFILSLHPSWDQKMKTDIIVFIRSALIVPYSGQNKCLHRFLFE